MSKDSRYKNIMAKIKEKYSLPAELTLGDLVHQVIKYSPMYASNDSRYIREHIAEIIEEGKLPARKENCTIFIDREYALGLLYRLEDEPSFVFLRNGILNIIPIE